MTNMGLTLPSADLIFAPCMTPFLRRCHSSRGKLSELYTTLQKFKSVRLAPFENEVARAYASMSSPLTNHINQMLDACLRKYQLWKQKTAKMLK